MKNIISILILTSIFLASCRKDGKDGSIYLKIKENTFYKTLEYYDSNEKIPANNFKFDREYLCYAGTYDFFYRIMLHDSSVLAFEGTYTLEAEPGEDGGFMKSATVGLTRHYVFKCTEDGADFYYDYLRKHPNSALELPEKVISSNEGHSMKISRKVKMILP